MIDNNNTFPSSSEERQYRSPEVKVVFVKAQAVLCQSVGPMYEKDYGDGGFHNN